MTGTITRRQQARNEKALQDLVQNVPGNNFCADCQTRNPPWASWSLGIFLCLRCASIHRKLGTHISKVKSLSMDSWSNEQVENMKKMGNTMSNQTRHPDIKRPIMPVDPDDADSAMERFIRRKYAPPAPSTSSSNPDQYSTGLVDSENDFPPPLPPKSPPRSNVRSVSNIFPLSLRAKREVAWHADPFRAPSPSLTNKPSKVFGATVTHDSVRSNTCSSDGTDKKLAQLRSMGFPHEERNFMALRGAGGNIEQAIEALIRLGEGDPASFTPSSITSTLNSTLTATHDRPLRPKRSLASVTFADNSATRSSQQSRSDGPSPPSSVSSYIFDTLPAPPQSSQSTGSLQTKNPYSMVANGQASAIQQQADLLAHAFGGVDLAAAQPTQSQPLFPHHTGGITAHQFQLQPPFPQSVTAPVGQFSYPSFYGGSVYPSQAQTLQTQALQMQALLSQQQSQSSVGLSQGLSQQDTAYGPSSHSAAATSPLSLYGNKRSPSRIQSPSLGKIPEQSQLACYPASPLGTQPYATNQSATLYNVSAPAPLAVFPAPTSINQAQQFYYNPQQAYPRQRPDNAAIMALYNYPHLAPQPRLDAASSVSDLPPLAQLPRSVSLPIPLPGSNNPFLASRPIPTGSPSAKPSMASMRPSIASLGEKHHRDSIALAMENAWSNGRHSPDAFANLSAKQGG